MQNRDLCREIVRQLWPYLDGTLSDEWQWRIVQHLEECVNCRSHYDFERAFLDAVRKSGAVDGDLEYLQTRVLAALASEGMNVP